MRALATAAVVGEAATELGNVSDASSSNANSAPLVPAPTRRSRSSVARANTAATAAVVPPVAVADEAPAASAPEVASPEVSVEVPAAEVLAETPAATTTSTGAAFGLDGAAAESAAESHSDAFEHAARLFAFSDEVAITDVVEKPSTVPAAEDPLSEVRGSAPRTARSNFRKIATAGFSVSVMGIIGAFVFSMSMPFMGASATVQETVAASATPIEESEIQAFVASSDVQNAAVDRESEYAPVTAAQIAEETGISYSSNVFTNDRTAAIQWPFAVGVDMSYGYGMRDGRLHEGIDFTPGAGAPIQAIADGVVRIATENGGNYGVTVYVDHVIDGEVITSHYSHMQYGSLAVVEGQEVKVGDPIGLTGNTGRSFGAHLHFELIVNGATIDPMPWLKEHAG